VIKTVLHLLPALVMLFLMGGSFTGTTAVAPYAGGGGGEAAGEDFEWMILIYVAGDNDLGEDGQYGNAALMDLDEMEAAIPQNGVRVLALTDLKGDHNSALYDIRPDNSTGVASPTIPLSDLDQSWSDELDMGDPHTLQRFISYAIGNTSFRRSMFVLWDHGSGWYIQGDVSRPPATRGFAQDMTPQRSMMYLDGMRDALMGVESELGHFRFDIMGFDTCYMGMAEVFYQFSRWSSLAVGSMDEQPWYGYNYTFIGELDGNDPHSPEMLAARMVEIFRDEYSSSSDTYHTIAVVDLGVLRNEFMPLLDMLSASLIGRMYHLEVERNALFSLVKDRAEQLTIDNVDLGSFLEEMIDANMDHNVTELAGTCLSVYKRMVTDSWIKPQGRNPEGTGVSIYLPNRILPYKSQYDGSTGFLNMSAEHLWDEMIREYRTPVERLRLELRVEEGGPPPFGLDLVMNLSDPREDPPVPVEGAAIWINGSYSGNTSEDGSFVLEGVHPGWYHVEAFKDDLVDIEDIKVLNRPPVAVIECREPLMGEGMELLFDGSNSTDPDGDLLTFSWDLDDSNGLNDTDHIGPTALVVFPDEGNRTIRLTVNDSEESSSVDLTVNVVNLPPNAVLTYSPSPPDTILEDVPVLLDASSSTDSAADIGELEFRFLEGSSVLRNWSEDKTFWTSFPSSGGHHLTLEVRDADGGKDTDTVTISVINREPEAVIQGPSSLLEDERAVFLGNGSMDTVSDLANLTYSWYVDGSDEPVGEDPWLEISWPDQGDHVITLEVTDTLPVPSSYGLNRAALNVTVVNMMPRAVISAPERVNESEVVELSAERSVDTRSDLPHLLYEWDLDSDGEFETRGIQASTTFGNAGRRTVSLKVTDDDGAFSVESAVIEVMNLPPTPRISASRDVLEDEPVDVEILPGWDTEPDNATLNVTWTLDGDVIGRTRDPPIFSIPVSGMHILKVTAEDDQGARGSNSTIISVTNPPPRAVLGSVPVSIRVGESFTASGYGSTDNPSDISSLVFIWAVDGVVESDRHGMNETFTFRSRGKRTITLTVMDDDGDSSSATVEVIVESPSPVSLMVNAVTSIVGLLTIMFILVLALFFIYRLKKNIDDLKPPLKDNGNEQEETGQLDEETGEGGEDSEDTGTNDEEGTEIGAPEEEEALEETQLPEQSAEPDGPEEVPPLDIEDASIPSPPRIDDLEIEDYDPHLLDPPRIQ